MKKFVVAVCDKEKNYLQRLQEYINMKRNVPFTVVVFQSLEECIFYTESKKIDVAVIASDLVASYDKPVPFAKWIELLTEENKEEGIYKYRPGEYFITRLLQLLGEVDEELCLKRFSGSSCIIGFYSPVKRCLQTSFAMTMGQVMAMNHRVLYLNFEASAGFPKRCRENSMDTLSELMYYMNNLEERFLTQFENTLKTINGMDYIPPAFSFNDLSEVKYEEWTKLLNLLCKQGSYEYILLDFSEQVNGLLELLRECDKVYTLYSKDFYAMCKMEQYEELLNRTSYEDILQKSHRMELPYLQNVNVTADRLLNTPLAEIARRVVREDFSL